MNHSEMTVKQLIEVAKELNIVGRHKMKREELLAAIEAKQIVPQQPVNVENQVEAEAAVPSQTEEVKPQRGGRTKVIEVWKDGVKIATINGLIETLKWAVAEGVSNQGWVKHSLKTGKETVAGRKFKEGGYLFKYAD